MATDQRTGCPECKAAAGHRMTCSRALAYLYLTDAEGAESAAETEAEARAEARADEGDRFGGSRFATW